MKRLSFYLFAVIVLALTASCEKKDDEKSCWEFKATTTCGGITSSSTVSQCELTEAEAESTRQSLESNMSAGGTSCTTTATKTKQ